MSTSQGIDATGSVRLNIRSHRRVSATLILANGFLTDRSEAQRNGVIGTCSSASLTVLRERVSYSRCRISRKRETIWLSSSIEDLAKRARVTSIEVDWLRLPIPFPFPEKPPKKGGVSSVS